MPDNLTIPSGFACVILVIGFVASIFALGTDNYLQVEQWITTEINGETRDITTAVIRYGLWRKMLVSSDSTNTLLAMSEDKSIVELSESTGWVVASAVLVCIATVACAVSLVLWIIWTFCVKKHTMKWLKITPIILVAFTILLFFVVFIGWLAEREHTKDEDLVGQSGNNLDCSFSMKWSWGMVVLAFLVQIIAIILMLISKERDSDNVIKIEPQE